MVIVYSIKIEISTIFVHASCRFICSVPRTSIILMDENRKCDNLKAFAKNILFVL